MKHQIAQTLAVCPDKIIKKRGKRRNHRASDNMLCSLIRAGNTWQKKHCCLKSLVSRGNSIPEKPKQLQCGSVQSIRLQSLAMFFFAAKLIEQFAILFFTSLAEKNLYYQGVVRFLPWEKSYFSFLNYYKLQQLNSSKHHLVVIVSLLFFFPSEKNF